MKIINPSLPMHLILADNYHGLFDNEDSLAGYKVEDTSLTSVNLNRMALSETLFSKVDFTQVDAERFDVSDCNFRGCNFTMGKFPESSWTRVIIGSARCSGLQITNGVLKNVHFTSSKLELVNFRFSRLENVLFEDCVLDDADFNDANLKNVEFVNCTINKISFTGASMTNVDISKSVVESIARTSNLKGVTISYDQLMQIAPSFATEAGIKIK